MLFKKNKALSLTELLIVLVIIALLFAAMAPIITKRHKGQAMSNGMIWNYVAFDGDYDAYFDPAVKGWTSSVFINADPARDAKSGKLVVNAEDVDGKAQHHFQFRYGGSFGENSANLLLKNNNILFGSDSSNFTGTHSTVAGVDNLKNAQGASNVVAFGDNAMGSTGNISQAVSVVAVGANAGQNVYSEEQSSANDAGAVFIGANSGGTSYNPRGTVAIGANAMYNPSANPDTSVYIGAFSGNGNPHILSDTTGGHNTIIGSDFIGVKSENNTIIGYGVYSGGDPDVRNMIAIGNGACRSVKHDENDSGSSICIGHNSGATQNHTPDSFDSDGGEHIYIGGTPLAPVIQNGSETTTTNGFAGRAVMEIHRNQDGSDANVVLNSNFVVRGNVFVGLDATSASALSASSDSLVKLSGHALDNQKFNLCSDNEYFQKVLDFYTGFMCKEIGDFNLSSNSLYPAQVCPIDAMLLGTSSSGCLNIPSDINLKEQIVLNNDGLDKILQLKPYNYIFKDDKYKTPQVGVIAQDLQKVFPISVKKGHDGYLKIRWDEMFYALINAIKDLNQKVEELASKLNDIKNDISYLKSSNSDAKKKLKDLNRRYHKIESKIAE